MQKVIVEGGQTRYVDLTPEEEAEVTARVKAGEEAAGLASEEEAARQAARAKVATTNPDLAVALGWTAAKGQLPVNAPAQAAAGGNLPR